MVEKFNPNEHLRTLTRRKKVKDTTGEHWVSENHIYLDVKWRITWFRQAHPEGFIQTVETEVNERFARIEATAFDKDPALGGKKLGMGRRMIYAADFKDHVEKCETQAIGQALAVAGFGTQFCEEFDEEDSFADAPVEQGKIAPSVSPAPPLQRAPVKEHEKETVPIAKASEPILSQVSSPKTKPAPSINLAYEAAMQKGLTRTDTDLFVNAKYQKLTGELDEVMSDFADHLKKNEGLERDAAQRLIGKAVDIQSRALEYERLVNVRLVVLRQQLERFLCQATVNTTCSKAAV